MNEQELQAKKALEALNAYKKEKYERHIQHESLQEMLYDLFEKGWHEDKVYQYEQHVVTLLSILLKPSVMNVLRKQVSPVVQDDITQMLLKLYQFFKELNAEYYLLLLQEVDIDQCEDIERLNRIEAKYKAKLEGCKVEQVALKARQVNFPDLKIVDNE